MLTLLVLTQSDPTLALATQDSLGMDLPAQISMNVLVRTSAVQTQSVPTPSDLTLAHALLDTLEMELFVQISTNVLTHLFVM